MNKTIVTTWGGIDYQALKNEISKAKDFLCIIPTRNEDFLYRNISFVPLTIKVNHLDNNKKIKNKIFLAFYSLKELNSYLISSKGVEDINFVNITRHPVLRVAYLMNLLSSICEDEKEILETLLDKLLDNKLYETLLIKYNSIYPNIEDNLTIFLYSLTLLSNDIIESKIYSKHYDYDLLIQNKSYLNDFLAYFSNKDENKLKLNYSSLMPQVEEHYSHFTEWQKKLYEEYFSLHPELNTTYKRLGYFIDELKEKYTNKNITFISIQLNSNKPILLGNFLRNLEETADCPEQIEVLVNIDDHDNVMREYIENKIKESKLKLKYISTHLENGFFDLWKPLNLLYKITDPNAYFISNLFDEVRFNTKGWDTILKNYINYYPDGYFRLRLSTFRFRNYIDLWECGFAPDSIAFYTKNWLDVGRDWNPCFGPDSFQQCVAYYLYTSDNFYIRNYYRDIPIANIEMLGEGASHGLDDKESLIRAQGHIKTWFILFSYENQLEAKLRALLIKANIYNFCIGNIGKIIVDRKNFSIKLINKKDNNLIKQYFYNLSKWNIIKTSVIRKLKFPFYAGGGMESGTSTIKDLIKFLLIKFYPRFLFNIKLRSPKKLLKRIARKFTAYLFVSKMIWVMNGIIKLLARTRNKEETKLLKYKLLKQLDILRDYIEKTYK